mmetsp:Transcript_12320/g.18760  ORF Transcript_12320/g.18760 Transcript_12320/m.18760 type:complete len:105 (-) Transcript_12320:2-316(-)
MISHPRGFNFLFVLAVIHFGRRTLNDAWSQTRQTKAISITRILELLQTDSPKNENFTKWLCWLGWYSLGLSRGLVLSREQNEVYKRPLKLEFDLSLHSLFSFPT